MNELTAKDRIEFDKCFICGEELNLSLKNNMSKHTDNWKEIEHLKFGIIKIHSEKHHLEI
jgi:hypothetical protein